MRIRTRVMFASSLLAVGLVAVAPSAYATEGDFSEEQVEEITKEAEEIAEQNGASGFDAECIAILMEGGSPEDCHEAPSPIFPATDELVWGSLSFLVLFLLMRKYAFPSIKKGMNDRSDRIRSDLDAAEQAKSEAAELLDGYRVQMADAQSEAGRIIDEARQTAEALKKDAAARLQTELAETRSRAATDIEAAKVQATADLKGETGHAGRRGRFGRREQEPRPRYQTQLIEDYIASVGAS